MKTKQNYLTVIPGQYFRNIKLEKESIEYNAWKEFCCEKENIDKGKYYQFGYETFGAILLKFCEWMIKDVKALGIRQVVFFSRDGYIIKRAFELISEGDDIATVYAYVSRRSLRVPLLWKYEKPSLDAIHPTRYISIQDLFESIGLDSNNYVDVLRSYGYTPEYICKDEEIENKYSLINLLTEVWKDVVDNSKKEFETAKRYFEQLDLNEKIAVVDIGWRGSIQHYLTDLLGEIGKRPYIRGYYITLSSSMFRGQDMRGFLLDVDDKSEGCDVHRGYVGLLETLFLKTEGSTKMYKIENGKTISPVLYPYEYEDKGRLLKEAESVKQIQEGAIQFIMDYIEEKCTFLNGRDSLFAFSNLHSFSTNPSMADLCMFEDFRFFNGTISYLAKAKPIRSYLFHPQRLIRDFYGARWRIGFLKSLFRIALPYNSMFNIIMKYVKK